MPSDEDVDSFLDSVSEVTRLIDGLKAGTLPPDYVDKKIAERGEKSSKQKPKPAAAQASTASIKSATPTAAADGGGECDDADAADTEAARQAELRRKLEELKASRQRKIKARELYSSYVQGKQQQSQGFATDYTQWDLWCPSDEEDDIFNSLTPNTPEFRAMERDISTRHERYALSRKPC